MGMQAMHRVARQSVELQVDTEAVAGELYAEVSRSFRTAIGPVLDEVFTAGCPPHVTIRLDRVEIDAGRVPRDGLMQALAEVARERLETLLGVAARDEAGRPAASAVPAPVGRIVTEDEVALERIARFLEHGAAAWRDAGATREELEQILLALVERAPLALRALLERLPPARVARRVWTQLAPPARARLLAWLGVADVPALQRLVADWTTVLARAPSHTGGSRAGVHAAAAADLAAALFARAWTLVLAGRAADVAEALGDEVLPRVPDPVATPEADRRLGVYVATAASALPEDSPVRRLIASRTARAGVRQRGAWTHGGDMRPEKVDVAPTVAGTDRDAGRNRSGVAPAAEPPATPPVDSGRACVPGFTSASSETRPADSGRDAAWLEAPGLGVDQDAAVPAALATPSASRRDTAQRAHTPFGAEPLWVRHAGVVILWPFLPRFFEACGLVNGTRFTDAATQARAVLLTAHLADGADAWGEHELLLEKLLCGYPGDEPLATSIELRDEERTHADELLRSVVEYWPALKHTSVDGLRQAFVCREGTLTSIASGWKLEIPRAGHDVLLDSLPWGLGVVVLPWMEQPLHVEW